VPINVGVRARRIDQESTTEITAVHRSCSLAYLATDAELGASDLPISTRPRTQPISCTPVHATVP
jgi:hypothetical protein